MPEETAPVAFVGAATLDAIALVDGFPAPDQRVVADQVLFAGGGPAATAAVAASRLGAQASFIGAVGDDADGDRIVNDLSAEGVDVSGIVRVSQQPSGASVIVVDRGRGTRAICNRPAPALTFPDEGRAAELLRGAAWVHVDHAGWGPLQHFLKGRGDARPKISVDAGNPIPEFSPEGVDLFVPTYGALTTRYRDADAGDVLAAALREGARTVVATQGAGGAVAATGDGRRAEVPGCTTDVLSTLGAGDVFHGALLAAVVRGLDLPAQLAYADASAAMSCRGLDGRSAIPRHPEVLRFLSHHNSNHDLEPAT